MLLLRRLLPSTCALAQASAQGMQLLLPSPDYALGLLQTWGKSHSYGHRRPGCTSSLAGCVLCCPSGSYLNFIYLSLNHSSLHLCHVCVPIRSGYFCVTSGRHIVCHTARYYGPGMLTLAELGTFSCQAVQKQRRDRRASTCLHSLRCCQSVRPWEHAAPCADACLCPTKAMQLHGLQHSHKGMNRRSASPSMLCQNQGIARALPDPGRAEPAGPQARMLVAKIQINPGGLRHERCVACNTPDIVSCPVEFSRAFTFYVAIPLFIGYLFNEFHEFIFVGRTII